MLHRLILFVALIQLAFAPVAQAVHAERDVQNTIGGDFLDQSMSVYLQPDGFGVDAITPAEAALIAAGLYGTTADQIVDCVETGVAVVTLVGGVKIVTRKGGELVGTTPATNSVGGVNLADSFSSFNAFKRQYGPAGPGQAWYDLVEQTPNAGRFAAEAIHNPANLIKLPHGLGTIHNQISGYYSSKTRFTGNQTVRQWLSTKSYQEQFDFGVQTIKDFGGSQYLPPHLR